MSAKPVILSTAKDLSLTLSMRPAKTRREFPVRIHQPTFPTFARSERSFGLPTLLGKRVAVVYVDELAADRKFVFLKGTAYRRILTGDHIAIRNPGRFRQTLIIEDGDSAIPVRRILPEAKPRNPKLADASIDSTEKTAG